MTVSLFCFSDVLFQKCMYVFQNIKIHFIQGDKDNCRMCRCDCFI